jgi:hypothetical protein
MLDRLSEFLARVRGLPVLLAILLAVINLAIQFVPPLEPLARTNLFLHLAVILGLIGILLARTL